MSDDPDHDHAPPCMLCGLGRIESGDTYVLLRGALMENTDLKRTIFVLDPDTAMVFIKLPNGQTAIDAPAARYGPTRYSHVTCMHELAMDAGAAPIDPEDEHALFTDIPQEFR